MDGNNLVGYIRVSSSSQQCNSSLAEQRKILLKHGVLKENIIEDVGSGRSLHSRPNLKFFLDQYNHLDDEELLKLQAFNIAEKKTFVVCFLDRISRDFDSGLSILRELEKKGFIFFPLDMPMIATGDPFIGKLVLTIMIWLAGYELQCRKKRQKTGIIEAKKLGKYSKPRKKTILTEENLALVKGKLDRNLTNKEIYKSMGISKSSFYMAKKIIDKKLLQKKS